MSSSLIALRFVAHDMLFATLAVCKSAWDRKSCSMPVTWEMVMLRLFLVPREF
jgi:hypothetical protein